MSEVNHLLYEAPMGYAIFKVLQQGDIVSLKTAEGQQNATNLATFGKMLELKTLYVFQGQAEAIKNINEISEGQMPEALQRVLEINLPTTSGKKSKVTLGVSEAKLAGAIKSSFSGLSILTSDTSDVVAELLRGVRLHSDKLLPNIQKEDYDQASLAVGFAYSRGRIIHDPKRSDRSIIEAIKTVDAVDKISNKEFQHLREAYGWHFPELSKIEPDNIVYAKLVQEIGDKQTLTDDRLDEIASIVDQDGAKAQQIINAAKTSMGIEYAELEQKIIAASSKLYTGNFKLRQLTAKTLEQSLNNVAPNLQALLGTMVSARLIEAAQGLAGLAKMPASTLQILGAEKALFRALKNKSNTPKYGLIFHSTFIGRASQRDKGRISRYLANKCAIASRIDFFSEEPSNKWGRALASQVEDRLAFFATGKRPPKNTDVAKLVAEMDGVDDANDGNDLDEEMSDAEDASDDEDAKAKAEAEKAAAKKAAKKAKKAEKRKREEEAAASSDDSDDDGEKKKKKKKKSKSKNKGD